MESTTKADYIKRDDTIHELNAEGYTKNMRIHKRILDIPAANVRENVRGIWNNAGDFSNGNEDLECSVCGEWFFSYKIDCDWNFCPNCGADMRPLAVSSSDSRKEKRPMERFNLANEKPRKMVSAGGMRIMDYKKGVKTMTNADKIRQMTDEELAYFIMPDDYTSCPEHIIGARECIADCTDCVLKWLKEEAPDD